MSESWLPSLVTATPEAGFALAISLARHSVKAIQPDDAVRARLRGAYAGDTAQLIASSAVIAAFFQTVAAANGWWR